MSLPKSFVDLASAYQSLESSFVNIIGAVVDVQSPTTARTGQWMFTFKLLDNRLRDSLWGSQGLTIRFFKNDPNTLPQVRQRGDMVLLRNIKITTFNAQPMALSNNQTQVIVFPVDSIPTPNYQIAYQDKKRLESLGIPLDVQKLTLEEQAYVIQLKDELSSTIQALPELSVAPPPNAPTAPAAMRKRTGEELPRTEPKKMRMSSFGKKFKTISEVRASDFADLCVLVVKTFPTQFGTCELYVTDYTQNKDMFYYAPPEAESENDRDGDQYGYVGGGRNKKQWPGPYGHLVLQLEVRNPHADYVNREVNEGDLVLLQNVRLKSSGGGMGALEGNMWQDMKNPEKIQIRKIKDKDVPEVHSLFERKERYWTSRNAKLGVSEGQETKKKATRSERKKLKKQRQVEKTERAAQAKNGLKQTNGEDTSVANGKQKVAINPHVRCGHEEVRVTSVHDILDPKNERHRNTTPEGTTYVLHFVNAKFRARVRAVDFSPKNLEDFAIPRSNDQDGSDDESVAMIDYDSSLGYEWSFSLLLEDNAKPGTEGDRLWVNVGHTEAQYLFGNDVPDPADLRENRKLLANLREKMCILWGNLEEKAEDEAVSNLPFECCLMEYGLEVDEEDSEAVRAFRKQYRMFGVTIS